MIQFVTGTDTGVGKTVAAAWLAARAAASGARVRYCKPLQTGLAEGAGGSDADFVRAAAGVDAVELLRFPEPLAPSVAARLAGATIDVEALTGDVRALADDVDLLVVEGAGGLLVPVFQDTTMADLATALGAALVIVARPSLGTLNHTALTVEAAARRGLVVERILLSGWPASPGVTERTNLEELGVHGVPIEPIPSFEGLDVEAGTAGAFSSS